MNPLEDSPFAQGAQNLGAAAEEGYNDYGGEGVTDDISTPSPEEPYLMRTAQVGVFGGHDDKVDFAYGGASYLPDGKNINPENFVRVKENLVKSGALQLGQSFRMINPETKKVVSVIVRDTKPDGEGPSIDVAPHVVLELGGAKNLLFDPRPVKGYPVAQYSKPYGSLEQPAAVEAGTMAPPASISGMGSPSGVPIAASGALRNASALDTPEVSGAPEAEKAVKNKDGSVTFPDGETWYPDGTKSVTRGSRTYFARENEKTGEWDWFDKIDSAKDTENKPIIVNKKPYRLNDKGELEEIPLKSVIGDKSLSAGEEYAKEKATRILQSVGELEKKVNGWTVGVGGVVMNKIPATDARDFKAELDTLKANIAFGELTEMRNASKTGGALGQVSNIELGLLESSLGALDVGQSPDNLKRQFAKIKGSIERWNKAKEGAVAKAEAPQFDPAAADAIREAARMGKITREQAIEQLRALGLK